MAIFLTPVLKERRIHIDVSLQQGTINKSLNLDGMIERENECSPTNYCRQKSEPALLIIDTSSVIIFLVRHDDYFWCFGAADTGLRIPAAWWNRTTSIPPCVHKDDAGSTGVLYCCTMVDYHTRKICMCMYYLGLHF